MSTLKWRKIKRDKDGKRVWPKRGLIIGGSWRTFCKSPPLWIHSSAFPAKDADSIDSDRTHYVALPALPPPPKPKGGAK